MTTGHDPDLVAIDHLSHRLAASLSSIEDHHHALATPCPDWDLAALVDHVTGGNWFTVAILGGASADDAMRQTRERFGGPATTGQRATSSVDEQRTAFRQPGVLDRTHDHVAGDLTGRQVLRLRLHDLIVHTWDIDQTVDPPASLPIELVEWGLSEMADPASLVIDHFAVAKAPTPAEPADDRQGDYLCHFGR